MKVATGIGIWIVLVGVAGTWLTGGSSRDRQRVAQLAKFTFGSRQVVPVQFAVPDLVQVGDPVFREGALGEPPIGRVARVMDKSSRETALAYTDYAEIEFFSTAPNINGGQTLTLHQNPQSMGWVIQTMLPATMRAEIAKLLTSAFVEHQAEITQRLQPLLMKALSRTSEVIREDFQAAMMQRADRIKAISARYQADFVDSQLTPLLREEVWPIIQSESRPLAEQIGQELWRKASIWRLTWRMVYDASPLPQRDLARKEFERFVQDHVVPTLQQHVPEFIELQKKIFSRVLDSPQVRIVAREGLEELSRDTELHALLLEILNDVVTKNERLAVAWQEVWNTAEAQAALADANDRLEPTITAIGETMFGNPKKRITPEFSKVLRNKVLIKDQRWFVLHDPVPLKSESSSPLKSGQSLRVFVGDPNAENPFHVPARPRQ